MRDVTSRACVSYSFRDQVIKVNISSALAILNRGVWAFALINTRFSDQVVPTRVSVSRWCFGAAGNRMLNQDAETEDAGR